MDEFTAADHKFMAQALCLARRGIYTAHPNPRVGCVLVKGGVVAGAGFHRCTGEAHAEIDALQMAGENARGCTAYVTLEPCSHEGRTPPCVNALAAAGVSRVVAAMSDPNPKVSGSGFDALRRAGITVKSGLMERAARSLNEGFVSRFERGMPFVRLKVAASLDGKTAMDGGESQWITGEAARRDVQKLRAAAGAVMTGIATVSADDPSLTVRDESIVTDGRQPLRVVLDSHLAMSPASRMLSLPGKTAVFCIDGGNGESLHAAGADIHVVPGVDGRTDLAAVMTRLGDLEINDVLVEAGPVLAGNLLARDLVDELVIYLAPHMMGSETRGMFATPDWRALEHRLMLEITDLRKLGADIRVTARPGKM